MQQGVGTLKWILSVQASFRSSGFGFGGLPRPSASAYMSRRLVPRGSVGRVTVHRELEQREVPCPLKKRKLEDTNVADADATEDADSTNYEYLYLLR